MANKRVSRSAARVTKNGSNAMEIQRVINKDYKLLFEDYRKLSLELWRIPATKYILGGVAITSLVPVMLRVLRNNPQIGNFFRNNVDVIENKVGDIGDIITDKIADLRSGNVEDVTNAHH
jgi:hypothetical protein